jgi:hypothetical protein
VCLKKIGAIVYATPRKKGRFMSLMPEVVEDGSWMVLLIVAFAFLWFHTPNKRREKHAERTMKARTISAFGKHRQRAA